MKPITLDITGFGAFFENVYIDFSEKNSGIFLISGATGSGKTTIFDAVVYALYGRASGTKRESDSLRSDFLADGAETKISFTFSINGNTYRAERTINKKSDKITQTAQLLRPDGTVNSITKQSDPENVNSEIERLLGLTAEQFTQICLLPQGEFEKILSSKGAKSGKDDREEILARLFDTEKIERLQELIQQKTKHEAECCEMLKTAFDTNVKHIDEGESEELAQAVRGYSSGTARGILRNHEKKGADLLNVLRTAIELGNSRLMALEEDYKKLDMEYMRTFEQTKKYEEAFANEELLYKLKSRLGEIEILLANEEYNDEHYFEKYKELGKKINEQKEKAALLQEQWSSLSEYNKITLICKADEERSEMARQELSEAEKEAKHCYGLFVNSQGAKLAAELKKGQPCPVCGSTEHPAPASAGKTPVDEKQLRNAQNKEQKKAAQLAAARALLNEHFTQRIAAMEAVQRFLPDFDFNCSEEKLNVLDDEINSIKNTLQNNQNELALLEKKHIQLAETINEQRDLLSRVKTLEALIKDFSREDAEKNNKRFAEISDKRSAAGKTAELLRRQIEGNRRTLEMMEDSLEQYKKTYHRYDILDGLDKLGKGQGKISFKRYVLGMFLDEILQRANCHFSMMSEGRFMLVRKKGAGTTGLDINVYDEYTGKERPSFTLSGGEKFKAALSMAFGMSETVQACSGGIKINTLLIDEGFGTLDSESGYLALEVLEGMSRSDLLIGIISHVDFLKNNIESQLEVVKNPNGKGSVVLTDKFM